MDNSKKITQNEADVFYRLPLNEWIEPSDLNSKIPWLKYVEICTALASLASSEHIEQMGGQNDDEAVKYRRPKAQDVQPTKRESETPNLKSGLHKVNFSSPSTPFNMLQFANQLFGY